MALASTEVTAAAVGARLRGRGRRVRHGSSWRLVVGALGLTVVTLITLLVSASPRTPCRSSPASRCSSERSGPTSSTEENPPSPASARPSDGRRTDRRSRRDRVLPGPASARSAASSPARELHRPGGQRHQPGHLRHRSGIAIMVDPLAIPLGVGAAVYLEEYAGDRGWSPGSSTSTSATWPACRRSSTASSASPSW